MAWFEDIFAGLRGNEEESQASGWCAIVLAWLCFGSFAVPMKWPSVVQAQVSPLAYQSYKTFWVFVTTHLVLLVEPYEVSMWGLVSGLCWVPAGAAAVVAVRHMGIARGQAIWQAVIILQSFAWGFLIFRDEAVRDWWFAAAALAALCAGIVGMASSFDGASPTYAVVPTCAGTTDSLEKAPRAPSLALGIAAALFNGLWGGSALVPQHYSPFHGVRFALSFAWGAAVVNATALLIYAVLVAVGSVEPMHLHLRVMALPGFLSGTLWSAGNFCSLYAVVALGQGFGCALIQCSVVVSGFWGICYFRELEGTPVAVWAFWMCVCIAGVLGLAVEKK